MPKKTLPFFFSGYAVKTLALLLALVTCVFANAHPRLEPDSPEIIDKHVLYIDSYSLSYPWSANIFRGITKALESSGVHFMLEHMDAKNCPPAIVHTRLLDLYRKKYLTKPVDVVIVSDNTAFEFVLKNRDQLFLKNTPIVFCGINDLTPNNLTGHEDITGVAEDVDVKKTIELIKKVQPKIKNVVLLTDQTTTGKIYEKMFNDNAFETKGLSLHLVSLKSKKQMLDELNSFPLGTTAILELSCHRDAQGHRYTIKQAMKLLNNHTKLPVYSCWGFIIEHGAIGGYVTSGFRQGFTAGKMAKEILEGKDADLIKILYKSPNFPMFNYKQMRPFNIKLSQIPENSVILNKPITLYDKYKQQLWLVAVLLVVQTAIIMLLIINIIKRRRVEHRLLLQEQELRLIFTAAKNISFIRTDLAPTPIIDVFSPGAETMFDISREKAVGKPITFLHIPEDIPQLRKILEQIKTKKLPQWSTELTLQRHNGQKFAALFSIHPVSDEDSKVIALVVVAVDISERKQAEQTLTDHLEFLQSLIDTIPNPVFYKNSDSQYVGCNQSFADFWGLTKTEIIGKTSYELNPGNNTRMDVDTDGNIISTGRKTTYETQIIKPDQTTCNIITYKAAFSLKNNNRKMIVGMLLDITEQKRTERIIRSQKQFLQQIIENLPVGVFAKDVRRTGSVYSIWNAMMELISGIDKTDILGQTSGPLDEQLYHELKEKDIFDASIPVDTPSLSLTGANKTRKDVHTIMVPVFDADGNPDTLLGIVEDISERKMSQKRLEETSEKLRFANKQLQEAVANANQLAKQADKANQAKTSFIANMSHEIRTPINAIVGFASLLSKTETNIVQQDYINTILESSQVLLNLISDILDVSKIESKQIKLEEIDFDLNALLESVIKIIRPVFAGSQVEFLFAYPQNIPKWFKSDPTRIRQIILNLVNNAIKFTHKGYIKILVDHNPAANNKHEVKITVLDTGIGIPSEKLKKIFEPFMQADVSITRRFGGTGLGLHITSNLANMLNGSITVDSQPGHGSSFEVTMILDAAQHPEHNKQLEKQQKAIANLKIALIDPNEQSHKLILQHLKSLNADIVFHVQTSEQALKLHGNCEPDALIYSNFNKERHDVIADTASLKHFKKAVTFLICNQPDGCKFMVDNAYFDAHIPKPVILSELTRTLALKLHPPANVTKQSLSPEQQTFPDKNILVVEDNQINLKLISTILKTYSINVNLASNGMEAIKLLEVTNTKFDLILMDLQMPEMGGIDATRIIRQKLNLDIPIIALTAAVTKQDEDESIQAGMDGFITKPISVPHLEGILQKYLV